MVSNPCDGENRIIHIGDDVARLKCYDFVGHSLQWGVYVDININLRVH